MNRKLPENQFGSLYRTIGLLCLIEKKKVSEGEARKCFKIQGKFNPAGKSLTLILVIKENLSRNLNYLKCNRDTCYDVFLLYSLNFNFMALRGPHKTGWN